MAYFRPSTIAIAALLVLCEERNFYNFQSGILDLISQEEFPFNMCDVYSCKNVIVGIINAGESWET